MRFRELLLESPKDKSTDKLSANFASKEELKPVADDLDSSLPSGKFSRKAKSGTKAIPHIRCTGIDAPTLISTLVDKGFSQTDKFPEQTTLSGKFKQNIFSFKKDNKIYSFVVTTTGKSSIAAKEFTPVNLGLAGKKMNKKELISATKAALDKKQMDPTVKQALLMLVDIAAEGAKGTLTPELNQAISDVRNIISVDFGEILAPISMMSDSDIAEFPEGNAPLIDVMVGKKNISVKSLSGSGTSFKSISGLMDDFESSMDPNNKDSKNRFNILKKFHPTNGGTNKDKIIAAAASANIPEYAMLNKILGQSKIDSFSALTSKIGGLNIKDYATFLKTFYPAMLAGNWGKPVGLPADGSYYLGLRAAAPTTTKAAGKLSFDSNPNSGGADILTYVLGVGLLNFITKGKDSAHYSAMMTDIVNKADAVIGKIDITVAGGLSVKTMPFSELQFKFQYHAPSHIPGNNLPGFMAVFP